MTEGWNGWCLIFFWHKEQGERLVAPTSSQMMGTPGHSLVLTLERGNERTSRGGQQQRPAYGNIRYALIN